MRSSMIILAAAAIGAVAVGAAIAVPRSADETVAALPAEFTDVSALSKVEVRDAAGRVVLSGTLGAPADDDDGDVERKTALTAAEGATGAGEAEVETGKAGSGDTKQEVEVTVEKLSPSTAYTIHLDGRQAASFTTDDKGKAEVELSAASSK